MEEQLALIIPAAGRGSRFSRLGIKEPKPLVDLEGRPFFWWAVESVRRVVELRQIIFVVLQEHIAEFSIDKRIREFYPDASVVAIPEVTSGAAETALAGLSALRKPGPVAINDCDHAFVCDSFPDALKAMRVEVEGALMCFPSSNPAYSYVRLNADKEVIGTVEKQVVSDLAIAGCYLFANSDRFAALYRQYKEDCPYDELFLSGMFNLLADRNSKISVVRLNKHCSFGTPEELGKITRQRFTPFLSWK